MAAKIITRFPDAEVELVKGGRGDFIVTVDGQQRWHKNQMGGEYPDEAKLIASL